MVGGGLAVVIIVVAIRRRRWHIKQPAAERELGGAMAVGEEAVVANAMEAVGQYMKQEAAHEFADLEPHDFALSTAAIAIVLPAETDMGLVEIKQAAVGDRDAMSVAREIGQDLLGACEGLLGIDDPFGFAQRREIGPKRVLRFELGQELQFTRSMHGLETLQEQAPEQARKHANRKKEILPASNPPITMRGDAAARHDAMHMRVMIEVLTPGVQDGGDADVGAKVF